MANYNPQGRLARIRNYISLVLYLAGGWRSYQEIGEEFGWFHLSRNRTARRNVRALEQAGLPVEWLYPPDQRSGYMTSQRVRLSPDWVARTPWLRRYILVPKLEPRPKAVNLIDQAVKRLIGVDE